MRFRRAVQRYGKSHEPVTPYQRAGQVWDDRIGSARVQARNWRLIALGNLTLCAGLAGGLLWQSVQSRVTPYVVEVDRLGEARAVAPVEAQAQPTDPQIAWHLGLFIKNVRGISMDAVLVRENWLEAYQYVTGRGRQFLDGFARQSDPFSAIGRRSATIEILSVIRASDRSFQVKWIERVFERGALVDTARWTAILTLKMRSPDSAETLRRNPLGIYVDGIDWAREAETDRQPGAPVNRNDQSDRPAPPVPAVLDRTVDEGVVQ